MRLRPFTFALVIFMSLAPLFSQGVLKIHHINVGQGSSTLIVGPTGITCLIDGGEFGEGYASVVPRLIAEGVTTLHYMVLTHFHTDHWGGLPEVINAGFAPIVAFDRGNAAITGNLNSYFNAVGTARTTMTPGTTLNLGGGALLHCVVANGAVDNGPSVDVTVGNQLENSRSLGLRLSYGGFQQSICGDLTGGGDATPDVESAAAAVMGDVDVMVMNHHGSFTSSNSNWVTTLAPEVTVCSCGAVSPYGHPHASPVSRVLAQPTHQAFYRLNQGSSTPGGTVVGADLTLATDGVTYTLSGGSVPPTTFPVDALQPPSSGAPLMAGDLVISEFLQNPLAVSDALGEWVEICNTTPVAHNLQGFVMRDLGSDSFTLPSLSIGPRATLVLGASGSTLANGGVGVDYVWPTNSFFLGNGSDEIILLSASGFVLDEVLYDNGLTYPDPNGASVERRDLSALSVASNFGVSTAVFGAGDRGTPGFANSLNVTPPWVSLQVSTPLTAGVFAPITISGGSSYAGMGYVIGISDNALPGILLPASQRVLDLAFSDLLILSVSQTLPVFSGFVGTLNSAGAATAGIFAVPAPGLILPMSGIILNPLAPDGVAAVMDNARLVFP
jgi:beta-lactamase superfamily II metal-dependent hydrolase